MSPESIHLMLAQIKSAVESGKRVCVGNALYTVIKDCNGEFLIQCTVNGYCIGLTWQDGETLNAKPHEFYIAN